MLEYQFESVLYQFQPRLADGMRLIVATGGFRRSPVMGDVQIKIVSLAAARQGGDGMTVNIDGEAWVDGLRYLAARQVIPLVDLALPRMLEANDIEELKLDPGKVADEFAKTTVEHARASGIVEAPEGHEFWAALRRYCGQSFYVGWFAGRTFGGRGGGR